MEQVKILLDNVTGSSLTQEEQITKTIHLAEIVQSTVLEKATKKEQAQALELSEMMKDRDGKIFTVLLTDQGFRSYEYSRVVNQILYLISKFGVPNYLSKWNKLGLELFYFFKGVPNFFWAPLSRFLIQKETSRVIVRGDQRAIKSHLQKKEKEGFRINLNHLGEAILGEEEAEHRLHVYMEDLRQPEVEYISVKISTLYSQINLLAWDDTLNELAHRFRRLLRTANDHLYRRKNGELIPKFVNLDMEEYRDLHLTVALFKKVLSEEEFLHTSAGIVLQSYLPDSYPIQEMLTAFGLTRVMQGGSPIKIRIVKGANLAMEKVEASLRGWPQAPYATKHEVDCNFKKMVEYGLTPERVPAVHIGIGSHNLFDLCYAYVLSQQKGIQKGVTFEMLEGMAEGTAKVLKEIAGDLLLYTPAASKKEFQNAIAYFVRRLDENTGPENFLRVAFNLKPGTSTWQTQADRFAKACEEKDLVSNVARRTQNRTLNEKLDLQQFINVPDTDWSLEVNRQWAEHLLERWREKKILPIPTVVHGKKNKENPEGVGIDPSTGKQLFCYQQMDPEAVEDVLAFAEKRTFGLPLLSIRERFKILKEVAAKLEKRRGDLLGMMLATAGKPFAEGDGEVSEAVDFANYYAHQLLQLQDYPEIDMKPKGTVFVASPWNFPCSIPAGGILASFAAGNITLFKPAPEAVSVGYLLAEILWEAGIPQDLLHFVPCEDEVATLFVKDRRVDTVVLTGATETAKKLLNFRPGLDLAAETGGKNSIIVTALADRDLAVKDIVQSAFGYAGQKCSACSLLILEEEVYEDPVFMKQLLDAARSLKVGSAWDFKTKIPPLISKIKGPLKKSLTDLEKGEEWLLKPELDSSNPNLMSPGIKWGVKQGNFTQKTELFGPILSVVCAKDLSHAIEIANSSAYGLTAGLHSLDPREHEFWLKGIQAGNCYINRGITGAIVQRQPFGGIKESSFGLGFKAGGPNYLYTFIQLMDKGGILNKASLPKHCVPLMKKLEGLKLTTDDKALLHDRAGSYSFFFRHFFSKDHDPTNLLGQSNIQRYIPHSRIDLRVSALDSCVDVYSALLAACLVHAKIFVSIENENQELLALLPEHIFVENDQEFVSRVSKIAFPKVRFLNTPNKELLIMLASQGISPNTSPVVSWGRRELLNYIREVSISVDYHRYGNVEVNLKPTFNGVN